MIRWARGESLRCVTRCETYDVPGYAIDDMNQYGGFTGVETIQAAAALNEEAGEMTVFVINADAQEDQELRLDARGFEGWKFAEHIEMYTEDPDAQNTWDHPDRIMPKKNPETSADREIITARLKKESWNILRFRK